MFATLLIALSMLFTPVVMPGTMLASLEWMVPLAAPAGGRVAIQDGLAFVGTSNNLVTAFDIESGKIVWQQVLPESTADDLAIIGDTLLVPGNGGTLFALSRDNGAVLQSIVLGNTPLHMPLATDARIAVANGAGLLFILDRTNLALEDTLVLGNPNLILAQRIVDNLLVIALHDDSVIGIDVAQARINWHIVISGAPTLVAVTDNAHVVVASDDNAMVSLSLEDGAVVWEQVLKRGSAQDYSFSEHQMLLTTNSGMLVSIDPANGALQNDWTLPSRGVFASHTLTYPTVILTNDGSIVAAGAGDPQWLAAISGGIAGSAAIDDGVLIVVTLAGDVQMWRIQLESND